MPESQAPEGKEPEGNQTPDAPEAPEAGITPTTFSQADLDRIVKERLARAVPADLEALRKKAADFDQLEESQKTELQKAQDKAKAAEAERDEARAEAARERLTARIETEAARQGGDTELILAVLAQQTDLEVDGVKGAVEKLLESKPHLKIGVVPNTSGGEFGGVNNKTIAERIAELEKKGDRDSLQEARALKIQNALGA